MRYALGWRESEGRLLLTLASLIPQESGDLDETVENVAFLEPYTLRSALLVERACGAIAAWPALGFVVHRTGA